MPAGAWGVRTHNIVFRDNYIDTNLNLEGIGGNGGNMIVVLRGCDNHKNVSPTVMSTQVLYEIPSRGMCAYMQ